MAGRERSRGSHGVGSLSSEGGRSWGAGPACRTEGPPAPVPAPLSRPGLQGTTWPGVLCAFSAPLSSVPGWATTASPPREPRCWPRGSGPTPPSSSWGRLDPGTWGRMEGRGACGNLGAGAAHWPEGPVGLQWGTRGREGVGGPRRLSTCFSLDKQEAREARAGGGRWLRLGGRKPAGPRGCQGSASPLCLHVATTWELLKNALA